MAESLCECIWDICECTLVSLWSIVSLALGLVFGPIVGVEMTLMVFFVTLARTPCHIWKQLVVVATNKTCFTPCNYFDPFLRIAVFFLCPIPHILWLVFATLCTFLFGTIYYIGKATKTIFLGRYSKQWDHSWTNIKLDRTSKMGSYVDLLDYFDQHEHMAEDITFVLKAICSFIPGVPLGALPFIPFTIAIVFITLFRLPINVFKTLRVAIRTVTLKWDLKLLALLMLPIIHTLFPLVMFLSAFFGSFFYFTLCTSISIAEGNSPFEEWGGFVDGIKEYHKAHEGFVSDKYLGKYDHPTGIPSGWKGSRYGLPIHQILRWQWDFLVSCVLLLFGMPICFVGSVVIFAVKLVPGILSWWRKLCRSCTLDNSYTEVLGCWAFWVCGYLFAPVGAVCASLMAICLGTLLSLRIPHDYLKYGCKGGLYAPLDVLQEVDGWDFFCLDGCRVFACLPDENPYRNKRSSHRSRRKEHRANKEARKKFAKGYWDRFARQCIRTTAELLEDGWITVEDVQSMDTSVLQAVPAIALLTILSESVNAANALTAEFIYWKIDGTRCEGADREQLDNIAALIWPKVMEAKHNLHWARKRKALAQEMNVQMLAAMLCSNTDEPTDALQVFLRDHEEDPRNRSGNRRLRSQLTELSLMILQVHPFQQRMQWIYSHNYVRDVEEVAPTPEDLPEGIENSESDQNPPAWRAAFSKWWRAIGDEASPTVAEGNNSTN